MELSVVIPAYNESGNIRLTIEELLSKIDELSDIDDVQVLVIDDHSSDDTYSVIEQMNDTRISCLRLSRRSGSFIAIRVGLQEVDGDVVLFIAADGQDDPSCIERMLEKWHSGTHTVWALRESRDSETWLYGNISLLFYRILRWLGGMEQNGTDLSRADFFLLDRVVIDAINKCPEKNTSLLGLIGWLGFKQDFIEYERRMRRHGKSKWNFRSQFRYASDWIIAFSGLPLRLASIIGILTALFGLFYAVYAVIEHFIYGPVTPGVSTIIILVLIMGGTQVTMLGIIGEYLWRNLNESRNRPLYFIEKRSSSTNQHKI